MEKSSMPVQQCARAQRCRKLLEVEDIKLQFETPDRHRIGDLFREHWQLNGHGYSVFINTALLLSLQFHFESIFSLNSGVNTVCPPTSLRYSFEWTFYF